MHVQKVAMRQRHVKHSCIHEASCWCFCRRTAGCVTAPEPSWMKAATTAMAKAKRGTAEGSLHAVDAATGIFGVVFKKTFQKIPPKKLES